MPAAILFDMDGTLIDSEHLWLEAEHVVMARLGGTWSEADQYICVGGPLERVVEHMLAKVEGSPDPDVVMDHLLGEVVQRFHTNSLTWRPGARDLLLEALERRIPTALVTASWARVINAVSDRIEEDLGRVAFTVVVAGDDVERSKPHPEPYLTAARILGVEPGQCLVLEDSPTGVRSGVDAGCRVIAVPSIALVDVDGATHVVTLEGQTIDSLWSAATHP